MSSELKKRTPKKAKKSRDSEILMSPVPHDRAVHTDSRHTQRSTAKTRPGASVQLENVANLFFEYVKTLDDETLRICETKEHLGEVYLQWRDDNKYRGSFSMIIYKLKQYSRLVVYKKKGDYMYIFDLPGKNSFVNRKKAIDASIQDWQSSIETSKGGLQIDPFPSSSASDTVETVELGRRIEYSIAIVNKDRKKTRTLTKIEVIGVGRFIFSHPEVRLPITLNKKERKTIKLSITPQLEGNLNLYVVYTFQSFSIGRSLVLNCGNPNLAEMLKPTSPYKKKLSPVKRVRRDDAEIVDGVKPTSSQTPSKNDSGYSGMNQNLVPSEWRERFLLGELSEYYSHIEPLDSRNYVQRQHELLWTEEMANEKVMHNYSIESATMEKTRSLLRLKVPGLSENRPSVRISDSVIVKAVGEETRMYRGYCHDVEKDSVLLHFEKKFHDNFIAGSQWEVQFEMNRTPFKIMHHGLQLCQKLMSKQAGQSLIFPEPRYNLRRSTPDFQSINRNLNEKQLKAVGNILMSQISPGFSYPYLIFGPPGTGKTTTMIESIKQFSRANPDGRLIVAAPSNPAADLLCLRLASSIAKSDMCRYNSYQRRRDEIHETVMKYSLVDADGTFVSPTYADMFRFKIFVCTCAMACKLTCITNGKQGNEKKGIERGHFAAVFCDEAGHAVEADVIGTFAGVLDPSSGGRLVLAGDPKQLGPVVHSDHAKLGGLEISFMERLMSEVPAYQKQGDETQLASGSVDGYDPMFITKLNDCYRCHADILRVPNEMFYDSELLPSADPVVSNNLSNWEHLPQPGFPLIFHGIQGKCEREGGDPSWFNISEVEKVLHYIKLLTEEKKCLANQIGVITPYRKHAAKIRRALAELDVTNGGNSSRSGIQAKYADVLVGTCELLQGQERRVIIISSVRSSTEFLDSDKFFNLGFISHPKRFNVAVTRAQALLITIGNPFLLSSDPCWLKLIEFCKHNGAYTGCEFELKDTAVSGVDGSDKTSQGGISGAIEAVSSSNATGGRGRNPMQSITRSLETIFKTEANLIELTYDEKEGDDTLAGDAHQRELASDDDDDDDEDYLLAQEASGVGGLARYR